MGIHRLAWLLVAAFPFLWTLWGSFKIQADFFSKSDWMNALTGVRTEARYGTPFSGVAYEGAWIRQAFWRAALNSLIVTISVTVISLTFGTLGGYALARSTARYAFVLLIVGADLPCHAATSPWCRDTSFHFFKLNIWGYLPTAIIVLVAINQPFTLWMLRSFFLNVPRELDESALVDGCTRWQAFRYVIMPVMWPGVITTGLFSFLLAYNDFAVTANHPESAEPDHGAQDCQLSRYHADRRQCHVCRCCRGQCDRSALCARASVPAP